MRYQQGILPIAVERTCSRCRGSGHIVKDPCTKCRGSGLVTSTNTLAITIPAGVEAGTTKLVSGAGNKSRPEKAAGDLEITIQVRPHPFFKRSGDDVVCSVPITFTQSALGSEVEVPTLEGRGKMRVPPGTQPGTTLRIKGKGIPHRAGLGRGDQRVDVTVEVPTQLTDRQKDLLEQLAKELGENVQPMQSTFFERLRSFFG